MILEKECWLLTETLAYFYAVVEDKADATKVVEEIEAERAQYPSVTKLEVVERKFFGKPVKAVKVYCKNPDFISKYSKAFRNFEGVKDCLEDDVRCSMRYLIDNNVVPCGWHEIEVNEEANTLGVQVDKVYTAESIPKLIEKSDAPELRILDFSTIQRRCRKNSGNYLEGAISRKSCKVCATIYL